MASQDCNGHGRLRSSMSNVLEYRGYRAALAAQLQGKSLNQWAEEVLADAANTAPPLHARAPSLVHLFKVDGEFRKDSIAGIWIKFISGFFK